MRTFFQRCCIAPFIAMVSLAPLSASAQSLEDAAAEQLATYFARISAEMASATYPSVETLETAAILAQIAADLVPDDPALQRNLMHMADLADDDELRRTATDALARLDPRDEAVRLQRLNDAIDRFQTADERIKAYDRLLSPENVQKLDSAIASRLALDSALLNRRAGNLEMFADRLALATSIDQSNAEAAALAAGYFRLQEIDPFAEAELLVNALVADPTDITTQAVLAGLLLEQGAYAAADTFYELASDCHDPIGLIPGDDFVADHALARWGMAERDRAIDLIEARQRFHTTRLRARLRAEQPDLGPMDRAEFVADLTPTLHALLIALLDRRGEDVQPQVEAFHAIQERAMSALDAQLTEAENPTEADRKTAANIKAESLLYRAWIVLWFTDDADSAQELLDAARALTPLTDAAQARFDGWLAYRRGDLDEAERLLQPLLDTDPAAGIGFAMVQFDRDQRGAAARTLFDVWSMARGNAMGLWSFDLATEILGTRPPDDELVTRLDTLVDSVPPVFLRVGDNPSQIVTLRVEPVEQRYGPHEPVLVRIAVRNNTSKPIGLAGAPVKPFVLIEPRVAIAGVPTIDELSPLVVELDRRLRLEPFETLEVVVDLRRMSIGRVISTAALRGTTIELKSTLNPRVSASGAALTGLLGMHRRTPPFRVDGARITPAWVSERLAELESVDTPEELIDMALLCNAVDSHGETTDPDLREALSGAVERLAEAFATLGPHAQAWIMTAVPPTSEDLEPLRQLARSAQHEPVQIAYLFSQVTEPDDPMLTAAVRSELPQLKRLGELIKTMLGSDDDAQPASPPADDGG